VLVDLHAHYPMHVIPSEHSTTHERLKAWKKERFRAKLVALISHFANYEGPSGDDPSVTPELLAEGGVGVALSVLYLPFDEIDFSKDYGDPPDRVYLKNLLDQMTIVEEDAAANAGKVAIARTGKELRAVVDSGRTALVHCLEGGFELGPDVDRMADNVRQLKERGLAYITVAHLFYRGVATNAPALPFLPDWLYNLVFHQRRDEGLSPLGVALVEAMVANRVVIDITHMSDRATEHLFKVLEKLDPDRKVPVFATHGACRLGSEEYCMPDETIREVAARDGVIGLILCDHHMIDGVRRKQTERFEDSLEVLFAHIDHVHEVTGSFRNVGIGSDLDGYIKPALAGLGHMGKMKELQDALATKYGAADAEAICSGNALRVLESYWGV
jgi:microsomal dipeptidase-like Zn-dependent dipeptidase